MSGTNGTTKLTTMERSAIFTEYNLLRGRGNVERGRLNRALGLAQTKEERPYNTTLHSCDCPDREYNNVRVCKHMAALRIRQQAEKADEAGREKLEEERRRRKQARPAPKPRYGKSKMWKGENAGDDVDIDRINDELFGR